MHAYMHAYIHTVAKLNLHIQGVDIGIYNAKTPETDMLIDTKQERSIMKSNPESTRTLLSIPSLLSVLLLHALHVSGYGMVYYNILPTQISPHSCPVDSCLTLTKFTEIITNHSILASNMTLFISGEHHNLNIEFPLSNVAEFVMLSANYTYNSIDITCTESANFSFTNVGRIYIKGVNFNSCNNNKFESIQQLVIEHSTFINSRSPLTLLNSNANIIRTSLFSNFGSSKRNLRLL